MTQIQVERCCLGHLSARKRECYECKRDEMNKSCSDYTPIYLRTFNNHIEIDREINDSVDCWENEGGR